MHSVSIQDDHDSMPLTKRVSQASGMVIMLYDEIAALQAEIQNDLSQKAAQQASWETKYNIIQNRLAISERTLTIESEQKKALEMKLVHLEAEYQFERETVALQLAETKSFISQFVSTSTLKLSGIEGRALDLHRESQTRMYSDIASSKSQAIRMQESADAARKQAAELRDELEEALKHFKDLTWQMDSAQLQTRALSDKCLQTENEMQGLRARMADLIAETERLKTEAHKREAELLHAVERAGQAERETLGLREAAAAERQKAELERLRWAGGEALAGQLREQIEERARVIEGLRDELEASRREAEGARRQAQAEKEALQECEGRVAEAMAWHHRYEWSRAELSSVLLAARTMHAAICQAAKVKTTEITKETAPAHGENAKAGLNPENSATVVSRNTAPRSAKPKEGGQGGAGVDRARNGVAEKAQAGVVDCLLSDSRQRLDQEIDAACTGSNQALAVSAGLLCEEGRQAAQRLHNELERLLRAADEAARERTAKVQRETELTERVEALERDLRSEQEAATRLRMEHERYMEAATTEQADLSGQISAMQTRIRGFLNDARTSLAGVEERAARLHAAALERLETEREDGRNKTLRQQEAAEAARREATSLQNEVEKERGRFGELMGQLVSTQAQSRALHDQLHIAEGEAEMIRAKMIESVAEAEALRAQVLQQRTELGKIQDQLGEAVKEAEELRNSVSSAKSDARRRESQISELDSELEKTRSVLTLQKSKIMDLESQLDAAKQGELLLREQSKQNELKFREEIEACRGSCQERGTLVKSLQNEIDQLSNLIKLRDQEIGSLGLRLTSAAAVEEALRDKLDRADAKFRSENARLQHIINEKGVEIDSQHERLEAQGKALEQHHEQILDLDAKLASASRSEAALRLILDEKEHAWDEERASMRASIESMSVKMKEGEHESLALNSKLEDMKEQASHMTEHSAELQFQLESSKANEASMRMMLDRSNEELEKTIHACNVRDNQKDALIEQRNDEITELKEQLQLAAKTTREAQKELKACSDLCAEKNNSIKFLQDELLSLKRALAEKDPLIKDLHDKLASATSEKAIADKTFKSQYADKDKAIKSLQNELAGLRKTSAVLEEQLGDCRADCGEKDTLIRSLQERLDMALQLARQDIAPKAVVPRLVAPALFTPKQAGTAVPIAQTHTPRQSAAVPAAQPHTPRQLAAAPPSAPDLVGVGIRLTETPPHRVIELVPGGPAATAGGVQTGDQLVEVAGRDVSMMPMSAIRRLIVGPQGSTVSMVFVRDCAGDQDSVGGRRFQVEMVRGPGRQ